MRTAIALIGFGKWGKILYKRLKKICKIKYILRSKDNIDKIFNNVKWAVIASPDKTHYKILKKLINAKINIFCEKPLTTKYQTTKKIINLANKNKIKIYISDIENFKKKKLILKKKNYIYRSKKSGVKNYDFLRKLFYHDIYKLYPHLKAKNIKLIKYYRETSSTQILINDGKKSYYFEYQLYKKSSHFINNVNFNSKKDYLSIMFKKVFSLKVNFKTNHKSAINAVKIIDMTNNARFYTKLF